MTKSGVQPDGAGIRPVERAINLIMNEAQTNFLLVQMAESSAGSGGVKRPAALDAEDESVKRAKAKAKADEKAQIRAERQAKLESIRINLGTSTSTATLTPTITITPVPRDGEETPAEPNPAATASGLSG
jgi:hypothetical protein